MPPSSGIAQADGLFSAPAMIRPRFLYLLFATLVLFACSDQKVDEGDLLLVTTTSVRDTGLLSALLSVFEEKTGIRAQVIAVGSGAALRMGRDGNADVLLTHAPEGEQKLVASGAAVGRTPIMENYFVIAGPPEDPAEIRDAVSPADAIRRIADSSAQFASRGDDSGNPPSRSRTVQGGRAGSRRTLAGFFEQRSGNGSDASDRR